jgi:hypothetical protein
MFFRKKWEELNNQRKQNVERQLAKKRANFSNFFVFERFASRDPFKKR